MTDKPNDRPTHDLTLITPGRVQGSRDTFTTICPVWITKDGEGFTAEIPTGLTITGRVLIQKRKDRAQVDA